MQEQMLLKWALMSTIIGLVLLFFISLGSKVDETTLPQLEDVEFGRDVKIVGAVSKVNSLGKISLIEVVQPQSVDIVVFTEKDMILRTGDFVEIIGELREFRGKQEIIADKVILLSE